MVSITPAQLLCRQARPSEVEMLRDMLRYQFCQEAAKALDLIDVDKLRICFSRSTKRVRAYAYNDKVLAMVRASDFYLVPHLQLGVLLHKVIPFPRRRVVVVNEMVNDILEGNCVFARHVIAADDSIRPFEEVLVVDEDDRLISLGRTLLDYETMITATRGIAVHIREKVIRGEAV